MVQVLVSRLGRSPLLITLGGMLTVLILIGFEFQAATANPLVITITLFCSAFVLLLAYASHTLARRMLDANRHVRLLQAIIDHTLEAMLITDVEQRIVAVNPAFERITGYSAGEAIGNTPRMLNSGFHEPEFFVTMWRAINEQGAWEGEIHDRHKNGNTYPKYLRINAIDQQGLGQPSHYVAVFVDISEQKAQQAQIEHLVNYDALTGLPNRVAFEAVLAGSLVRAEHQMHQLAVLLIDLDNFKTINDSLGHRVGDLLLCEVTKRLRAACGETGKLARLGGDEFVILFDAITTPDEISHLAQVILKSINQPYQIDAHELHTSPSMGISFYPGDGCDASTLMRNADTAMYYAKSAGRNCYQYFAEPMNAAANKRLHLENELWRALAENQLTLHYQPQVDLFSGKVVGVEALIRWNHPERGMIPPVDFIPVAEECGLILPIGHWVLVTACRQAKEWLDAGNDVGEMAVNISAHQFRQPEFAESVRQILADTGLSGERLELEITESAVMSSADTAIQTLHQLKAMGVKLAIDDFGTGYSSLSYLRRFPVDRLKIDRSFVTDIDSDVDAASLVTAIITLGRSLGLRLVAEGVETSGQADFLREQACERVQGFHFYRPGTADDALQLLQKR